MQLSEALLSGIWFLHRLLKHKRISPSQADKWKQVQVPPPGLAATTKRLGWQHGYRFRTFPGFAFIDETAEDGCVCWFKRGAFGRAANFL